MAAERWARRAVVDRGGQRDRPGRGAPAPARRRRGHRRRHQRGRAGAGRRRRGHPVRRRPVAVDADRDRLVADGAGVDYLVNAAGIIRLKPILEFTVSDLRDIYAINVEATWDLVSRIGRTMPSGWRHREPLVVVGQARDHDRGRRLRVVQGGRPVASPARSPTRSRPTASGSTPSVRASSTRRCRTGSWPTSRPSAGMTVEELSVARNKTVPAGPVGVRR